MSAALVGVSVIIAFFFFFFLSGEFLVRELSREPLGLLSQPLAELPRIRRVLSLTGRLSSVLARADVERAWLDNAIDFFTASAPGARCRLLTRRLDVSFDNDDDDERRVLSLGTTFPLNIESCLVYQPPPGCSATNIVDRLRDRVETLERVTLILAADVPTQTELHRIVATNRSHLFVAPSSVELTALLLASYPMETLARIIASQVKLGRVSPYKTGAAIGKDVIFFGREEELKHILNRESANYFVVGGRQVGKSSLLKAIERQGQNTLGLNVHYLVLSGSDLTGSLAFSLGLGRDTSLDDTLAELGKHKGRTLCLIDEADDFIRSKNAGDVLAQLRSFSEEARCHFILAGFWDLFNAFVIDYHSPLRNFGEPLRIGALEEDACRQLAKEPMASMGLRYESDELVERLVRETGQRANLIAIVCNAILIELEPGERTITSKVVDAAFASWAVDNALEGWTQLGSEDGSRLDRVIVYATIGRGDCFTLADVLAALAAHGVQTELLRVVHSLKRLELAYVIGRSSGTAFTYTVPLFVRRMREQGVETLLAEELRTLT